MKIIILLLASCLATLGQNVTNLTAGQLVTQGQNFSPNPSSAAGGTCLPVVSIATATWSYVLSASHVYAQPIKRTGPITVCSFQLKTDNNPSTWMTAFVSTNFISATPSYGSSYATMQTFSGGVSTWSFTINPVVTGTVPPVYLVFMTGTGASGNIYAINGDTYSGVGVVIDTGAQGKDLDFGLSTVQ